VANADIIIADEKLLPQAVDLYNAMFRPKREIDFFKRRFMGRYNTLTLLARMDDKPVGFWVGFELKPGMFYHWLGAVLPDVRRHGVGRQLQEAQQAWAKDHGYEYIRCECLNHQREFIHFAIALGTTSSASAGIRPTRTTWSCSKRTSGIDLPGRFSGDPTGTTSTFAVASAAAAAAVGVAAESGVSSSRLARSIWSQTSCDTGGYRRWRSASPIARLGDHPEGRENRQPQCRQQELAQAIDEPPHLPLPSPSPSAPARTVPC
jgi:GNAT superfamily N-acetyltransferase